jgi:hypothetical protein
MKTAKELKIVSEKSYINRVNNCIEDLKHKIETAAENGAHYVIDLAEITRVYRVNVRDLSLFFVELSKLGYTVRENETYEKLIITWG